MFKKKFNKKSLTKQENFESISGLVKGGFSKGFFIKLMVLVVCIGFLMRFGQYLIATGKEAVKTIGKGTATVVSQTFGKEMTKDINGNINVLLIGVGGRGHAGSFLADTTIVASFSPKNGSVTMISIPRDLFVSVKGKYTNKINSLLAYYYNRSGKVDEATSGFVQKVEEIVGLKIPYFAVVDFEGFISLVDSLGGIEVNVPYSLVDTSYPLDENRYTTFSIKRGLQTLNGDIALKYARSRHSTSDFSRSYRQQLIIKAIADKILSFENITSRSKVSEIYTKYKEMVTTNVSSQEVLRLVQYAENKPEMFNFNLTMECSDIAVKLMDAGCFLYPVGINEMSAMIPIGGTTSSVSTYDYINFFTYLVAGNPEFLKEKAKISIKNSIDEKFAKKFPYRNGMATKLGTKLKRYGFDISDVSNSEENFEKTFVKIYGSGNYSNTLRMMKIFFDYDGVVNERILSGSLDNQPNIEVYLGNDFMEKYGKTKFSTLR